MRFFGRHVGHALGHADAEVDHLVRAARKRSAAAMILRSVSAIASRRRSARELARKRRRLCSRQRSAWWCGLVAHHGVDQHPGHLDLPGLQRAALRRQLNLRDDHAPELRAAMAIASA